MDKLIFLGTGAAMSRTCFTTAIALVDNYGVFLMDTGGGNGILSQLDNSGIAEQAITDVFISHVHTDHILGAPWLMRLAGHGQVRDESWPCLRFFAPTPVINALYKVCSPILPASVLRRFGDGIRFQPVEDGDTHTIRGRRVTFFDIGASKVHQFGCFTPLSDGSGLCYLGDEPLSDRGRPYAKQASHLIHEAFAVEGDERINPRRIGHSTVKEAALNARSVDASHLILFHSVNAGGQWRKITYQEEAAKVFSGRISVPDDLEAINLND